MIEDKLKHLRKSMDKSVFSDTTFESSEKAKILNELNRRERNGRFNLNSILSFAVCTFLFIGIGVFVFNQVNEEETNQTQGNTSLDISDGLVQDTDEKNDNLGTKEVEPSYPYIVLDGYYYKKTNEVVSSDEIGEKIGEVKRIGDWAIKKSGDSNEIPPGPIYSVNGKIDYIAGKGVIYKEGKNQAAYIAFKKEEPVEQPEKDSILSSKGDLEEVQIALKNIKEKIGVLYSFVGLDNRVSLNAANYSPENGPGVDLVFNVPEADKADDDHIIDGMLFIRGYKKNTLPSNSRFLQQDEWKRIKNGNTLIKQKVEFVPPTLIETFKINGITWGYYEDNIHNDFILRGEVNNIYYEVTTQGYFTFERLKELLEGFKQIK
jgi:small nuclear ribonucleoprotein (snRNP)-like protein